MKKLIPICLIASLTFTLSACQENQTNGDMSKVQESIDKIKAKLQEDLSTEKASKEDQEKESIDQDKDTDKNSDRSKPTEPEDNSD